jgi:hypothetical protein
VLFTFQGAGPATAGTPGDGTGLHLVRLPWSERSTAKLDLLLSAMEKAARRRSPWSSSTRRTSSPRRPRRASSATTQRWSPGRQHRRHRRSCPSPLCRCSPRPSSTRSSRSGTTRSRASRRGACTTSSWSRRPRGRTRSPSRGRGAP